MAVRVAIVGAGMIANAGHIPAWQAQGEQVTLRGVYNHRLEKAQRTAERHRVPGAYDDLGELLMTERPDIVSICTPNVSHAPLIEQCLRAGAHVVCEKPLTTRVEDAERLFELAASKSLHLVATQTGRFSGQMQAAHDIVAAGRLGEIYYAESAKFRRRGIPTWGSFHKAQASAGGPLFDLGVHALDALIWIMGNPTIVAASGTTYRKLGTRDDGRRRSLADSGAPAGVFDPQPFRPDEFSVEDMGVGFLRLADGGSICLRTSWAANIPDGFGRTAIVGTEAGLLLDPLTVIGSSDGYQSDTQIRVPQPPDVPFHGHHELAAHVLRLIAGDEEPIVKPEEVLNVLRGLTALYESADAGREIVIG